MKLACMIRTGTTVSGLLHLQTLAHAVCFFSCLVPAVYSSVRCATAVAARYNGHVLLLQAFQSVHVGTLIRVDMGSTTECSSVITLRQYSLIAGCILTVTE